MTGKTPQGRDELLEHLRTQVRFIRKSALAFDDGDHAEAQRIALALRVLLHEKGMSRSLLLQLGLRDVLLFHDTSGFQPEGDPAFPGLGFGGLVWMALGRSPRFYAPLGRAGTVSKLPFSAWWEAATLRVPHPETGVGYDFSRKRLVLTMTEQDGGAHVDQALDEPYYALTRESLMGEVAIGGKLVSSDSDPVPHAIRQIAHEVLSTLEEQAASELG